MADAGRSVTSGYTENRMSAASGRIELITRGERRRSWTIEQKREIAIESLAPGVVTAAIARKHEIGTGLLYTWRKQLLSGELGATTTSLVPSFLCVDAGRMPTQRADEEHPSTLEEQNSGPSVDSGPRALVRPEGLIEILLAGGVTVRVDAQVDGAALSRVVAALEGR